MSKKKTKLYETSPIKGNSKTIHLKVDVSQVNVRNLLHFEIQKKYRVNIVESKKKKPLKYKHKIYDYE